MGRRYLKHTRRKPHRLRHLKRVWTNVSIPAIVVDAPIAIAPERVDGVNSPWRISFIGGTPKWATSWAVHFIEEVILTGVRSEFTVAATMLADLSAQEAAASLAASLDARAELVCAAPEANEAFCVATLADPLKRIISVKIGASSNVAPAEPFSEGAEVAEAVAPVKSAKKKKVA